MTTVQWVRPRGALGDVAQLPAWNAALAELGDRYVAIENRDASEQTAAHLEAATPLLRGLARYVAVEACNPDLFRKLEAVSQNFEGEDDWSTQWWEVPFEAVINAIRAGYSEIPGTPGTTLEVLEDVGAVVDLRAAFQERGIAIDPDPYEIARRNKDRLDKMLSDVHDLHRTWVELEASGLITPEPLKPLAELDSEAYLRPWLDPELLERVLLIVGDMEFVNACDGCASLDEIRERLKLDPKDISTRRRDRLRLEQNAKRQQRMFDVAGTPFEVGTSSYGELFRRLSGLADPKGPCANEDKFTPLENARPGKGGGKGGKTSHSRPPAELRDLVGVVGEILAYHFLRAKFGNDAVTLDAWVSEIRLEVQPPVAGELNDASDDYGFDFRFSHRGKRLHVEVKATMEDDQQFDLGISEIKAANSLAQAQDKPWRILRVRNALGQPEFDWLPNPFEGGSKKYFHLHKGGMMVSYTRKKT